MQAGHPTMAPSPDDDALAASLGQLTLASKVEAPPDEVLLTIEASSDDAPVQLTIRPRDRAAGATTALIFDARMCAHRPPDSIEFHPERPERITAAHEALVRGGLSAHCLAIPARLATRAEVELAHERHHWDRIEAAVGAQLAEMEAFMAKHDSLYINSSSMDAARLAAGGLVDLATAIVTGQARNGMALVRPPAHHAEAHTAMGFCVLNSIAIAAQHARLALGCQRVLIVDWDVHHGNGIQHIFEDDPSVLYFSVHRYERGGFYPNTEDAAPHAVGTSAGRGTSVNVGWNTRGSAKPGDAEYLAVWRELLMPLALAFDPNLVIIAAGFDAAEGDPLGGCHVSPAAYAQMTKELMTVADGKVALGSGLGRGLGLELGLMTVDDGKGCLPPSTRRPARTPLYGRTDQTDQTDGLTSTCRRATDLTTPTLTPRPSTLALTHPHTPTLTPRPSHPEPGPPALKLPMLTPTPDPGDGGARGRVLTRGDRHLRSSVHACPPRRSAACRAAVKAALSATAAQEWLEATNRRSPLPLSGARCRTRSSPGADRCCSRR